MFPLGHVGITLGTIGLLTGVIRRLSHNATIDEAESLVTSANADAGIGSASGDRTSWLTSWANNRDYMSLILGSMLPDIIDKPVGLGICKDRFSNGRIFSHTLLFPAILSAAGFLLYRCCGKTSGISLSVGAFAHLMMDRMWREPKTLFWPLFGLRFKRVDTSNWLAKILRDLFHDPAVYIPEIIGARILWRRGRR